MYLISNKGVIIKKVIIHENNTHEATKKKINALLSVLNSHVSLRAFRFILLLLLQSDGNIFVDDIVVRCQQIMCM